MKILILEGLHGNNKGKKCQWRLKRTNLKVGDTVVLNCHDWKIIKVIGEKKRNVFPRGIVISEYSTGFIDNKYYKAIKEWAKIYDKEKMERIGKILIVKNIETGGCRKVKANEIDCFNPNVGDHINHYEIIVKIINKEVKKVRPYFEMEVVKVKKEKKEQKYCPCCGGKIEMEKPIGNWINGENLDKIKFPCFCKWGTKRTLGQLNSFDIGDGTVYELHNIGRQCEKINRIAHSKALEDLIDGWSIHILKGKIILFEEEK